MTRLPPSARRAATVALTAVLVLLSLQLPAQAAPRQVAAPWVKATSTSSVTLEWRAVPGASRYQVFWSTSYAGVLSKSAPSRKTGGAGHELKIAGLKPGKMYCFQVRALKGGSVGKKSPRHCKMTMRRANNTSLETAHVATFNVCSQAGDCDKTWVRRVPAIVQAVKMTGADLIGFQELDGATRGLGDIERALAPLGYARAEYKSSKAIFYRTSRFSIATDPGECWDDEYTGSTAGWDRTQPRDVDGHTYTFADGVWTTEFCDVGGDRTGEISLGDGKWGVWTDFVSSETGKVFRFVDAHLITGNSSTAINQRYRQTQRLLAGLGTANAAFPGVPDTRWIIVGDLNSHRNRSNDTPRKVLESRGWYDTYDRSATFATPNYNSANQWRSTPIKGQKYGDHVDHVFVKDAVGSTAWRTVHQFVSGSKYKSPLPSDHVPVRVTLYLP